MKTAYYSGWKLLIQFPVFIQDIQDPVVGASGDQNPFVSLPDDQTLFMGKGILLFFFPLFFGQGKITLWVTASSGNVRKKRQFLIQNKVSLEQPYLRQRQNFFINADIPLSMIIISACQLLHINGC